MSELPVPFSVRQRQATFRGMRSAIALPDEPANWPHLGDVSLSLSRLCSSKGIDKNGGDDDAPGYDPLQGIRSTQVG